MPGEKLCPSSSPDADPTDWGAFKTKGGFEIVELVFCKACMSAGSIDKLFKLCSSKQVPFSNHAELYAAIDSLTVREVPWQSFSVQYTGIQSNNSSAPRPKWMLDTHEIFYCDPRLVIHEMLVNPDFKDGMDVIPYHAFDKDGIWMYQHLMGRNWAWEQAVRSLLLWAFGGMFQLSPLWI